ncbi:hypothetical protein BS636_13690 [Acinetobacter sp. LoGeW2-3]|uniref:hypothetical protein n=1 Tax=Acinetobacter sp. LoGeW2-3 TaxID=1808001 RepID=UPI000C05BC93|nr:hypothetical protein [Acinetobacter sp. LoGeW2-3]ATO20651.1 hypothetical protein BS636_13690 [Acinetobacter sp. LoGeW2-3]
MEKNKLWAVNIPEEPDSEEILYPIPSKELGEQLVERLRQEAMQVFEGCIGECIAESITLEEWNGSEFEHMEYLISNLSWWDETTFLDGGVA